MHQQTMVSLTFGWGIIQRLILKFSNHIRTLHMYMFIMMISEARYLDGRHVCKYVPIHGKYRHR